MKKKDPAIYIFQNLQKTLKAEQSLLEKRDNLTSLILPDDVPVEEDQGEQDELFPLGYEDILEDC